jgi:Secretion system C-terminal sorting domain
MRQQLSLKRKIFNFVLILFFIPVNHLFAQNAPTAEPVYGGYVEAMKTIEVDAVTSRVYASTLSSNTMFYMDVDLSGASPVFGSFQNVPDMDWDDDLGGWVRSMAADEGSGFVFAATGNAGFVATDINPGSIYEVDPMPIESVEIYDSNLFYLKMMGNDLYLLFRSINTDGSVGTADSLLVTTPFVMSEWSPNIVVSPFDEHIYVYLPESPPQIFKTSDTYDVLSSASTTFTSLTTTDLAATSETYFAMTVAPDGRIIVGGFDGIDPNRITLIGYSDADGDPWTTYSETTVDCGWAQKMTVIGNSTSYKVFFGRGYNSNNGESGGWTRLPNSDVGGHVQDGPVEVDPLDSDVLYFRSDWGFATSVDGAATIQETNDGLVAVQVNGFAMDETKETAWVASKSGVWHVTDYQTTPVWVSTPFWPQMDTTPYTAVASSITADTVYVANSSLNLYRYESADGTLDNSNFSRILEGRDYYTQHSSPSSIAIDSISGTERLAVGVYDGEDWGEADGWGGVLFGEFDGTDWNWEEILGGAWPDSGADVNDVLFVEEFGDVSLYAGAEYYNHTTGLSARSVFKIVDDGAGGWDVTQDMLNSMQNISVSILDLTLSENGYIYACGTDVSQSHPVIYRKAVEDSIWESLTLGASGLPGGGIAKAITVDQSTNDVYIAVDHEIYLLSSGATSWSLYYEYPVGTEICFIYYDELLVGTGTGLYAHGPNLGIDESSNSQVLPNGFKIDLIYPNPFNASTNVSIYISESTELKVSLYNVLGQKVIQLLEQRVNAGTQNVVINADDISSGIYFIRVESPSGSDMRKIILLR